MTFKVKQLSEEWDCLTELLREQVSLLDYNKVLNLIRNSFERLFYQVKKNQKKKLQKLIEEKTKKEDPNVNKIKERWVVDRTISGLKQEEISVLQKGLNYNVSASKIPKDEIITNIQTATYHLNEENKRIANAEIASILKQAHIPEQNLSKNERVAPNNIKRNPEIKVMKADKGNVAVVMNTIEYDFKLSEIVESTAYQKVTKNPMPSVKNKTEKLLRKFKNENKIEQRTYYKIYPKTIIPPRIYGLPKIHKRDVPLRPIVSYIDTPVYELSKYVTEIIKPLQQNLRTISNSSDLLDKITHLEIENDEIMISFDVVSLFTSIPVEEAIGVIFVKLERDHFLNIRTKLEATDITSILSHLFINSAYFKKGSEYYSQNSGLAMGNPASPVIANIFMEHFEDLALSTTNCDIKFYGRYVDDTFVIIKQFDVQNFTNHLNGINPAIQFTSEVESNGRLPFLDCLIFRDNNKLQSTLYQKPTSSQRYLNFNSDQSNRVKDSVIISLYNQCRNTNTTNELFRKNIDNIKEILKANNYPIRRINNVFKQQDIKWTNRMIGNTSQNLDDDISTNRIATIPYVSGLTETLSRCVKKYDIKLIGKCQNKISSMLSKLKTPLEKDEKCNIVYNIPCSCEKITLAKQKEV